MNQPRSVREYLQSDACKEARAFNDKLKEAVRDPEPGDDLKAQDRREESGK